MMEELKEIVNLLPDVSNTPVRKDVDSRQPYSTEMANSDSADSSLPPSLPRNLTPSTQSSRRSSRNSFDKPSSRSSHSGDDQASIQISFSETNQQINVDKEISEFVKELDANGGSKEFVSTTETPRYEADVDNQYSKISLLASESSRFWDAKIHSPSSASNDEEDDVSSLEMTYYAFKETTGQKSGIPVSLLAAHLETKEPRYPSFFGSRSSVSVTENSSAVSFRNVQRSPSRRTSMEIIHPAFSPQVMEVINALEAHKKKAESGGNYVEARAANQRLNGVKVLEDNKRKRVMVQRHQKQRKESEKAYKQEMFQRSRLWNEKLHEFLKAVVEHAAKLKRQQISVLQAFRQRMAAKTPNKPQWSREVLKHKKVQTFLGKQGKYLEADKVKNIVDRLEHTELQATRVAYATDVGLKEQALRTKQQNEMKVLLKRAAQGSDELRKTRDLDLERCSQRHKNIAREFRTSQRQERMRFEQILGKHVKEFKESGGNLQLLSETLSGMDSWSLPAREPLCPVGDVSASSYSSDSHGSD